MKKPKKKKFHKRRLSDGTYFTLRKLNDPNYMCDEKNIPMILELAKSGKVWM